jgi:hypothetical protein
MQQPAVLLDTPTYYYALPNNLEGTQDVVLIRPSSRFYDVHTWRVAAPDALPTETVQP